MNDMTFDPKEDSRNYDAKAEEELYYLALNTGYYRTIEEMPMCG